LRQVVSNLSVEGLVNFTEDGRARPWLIENWETHQDGLSLTLLLRKQSRFHDGTSVNAATVAEALRKTLPSSLGPAANDLKAIREVGDDRVRIELHRPSQFVLEALDTNLQKPGKVGGVTGPFVPSSESPSQLHANADYYLGRPALDQISVAAFPSVRTAWAELLRGNLDMLYEVNVDALDSLQESSNVAVFSFVRHYQYTITFGNGAKNLNSPQVRRELNAAIDRSALVQVALSGHGVPSTGPVPPRHWAFEPSAPRLRFDTALAKNLALRHLTFVCLVPADSVYERVALAVKQQLASAGVDMQLKEGTQQQLLDATRRGDFEAILVDPISGPSLFRSYRQFYSKIPFIPKPRSSPLIDAALDSIGHAKSDDEYRAGVTAFQQAILDDPPAIFLAWGERARAVSRRFDVPMPENGRDVLATLRFWRPATVQQLASRN
jgi:peptide/nickel transport system substrate-binding protein